MRGRPAAPLEAKIARGRMTKAEQLKALRNSPHRMEGVPTPPGWLSGVALEAWHNFSQQLIMRGQLSVESGTALLALSTCYEDWVTLKLDIRKNGHTQLCVNNSGETVERIRPNSNAFADADRRLRYWLTEFGLTDATRGKVIVGEEAPAADDPLARYGLN